MLYDVDIIVIVISATDKYSITAQGLINSDVFLNGDGVNAQDALSIQKYKANQISEFPESYMS